MEGFDADAPNVPSDIAGLVRTLHDVVGAIDQARALGLPVGVPDALYQACRDVVVRHDENTKPGGGGGKPRRPRGGQEKQGRRSDTLSSPVREPRSAGGVSVKDMPLRRLIWQVIDPGEEFTVLDVAERLSNMGASWPPNKVSNALGYWVSRNRLSRQRKGVYSYPLGGMAEDLNDEEAQGDPVSGYSRIRGMRGKEDNVSDAQTRQRKAM